MAGLAGAALRRVPWVVVWRAARWLFERGNDILYENLDEAERRRLGELMRKSKGRPSNLTERERERFRVLVSKAVRGSRDGG